ncbi:hypothetical protein D4764_22G0000310 [Takifugu flavidus]|uniref:Uncharacterized protein n=1 Tax=Takifugu flavidus TaxID=433684 RepID=A0A5C6NA56_9TELE|nr:hypothetical protein D4764_22G0000310 [Takifugu flavidus]
MLTLKKTENVLNVKQQINQQNSDGSTTEPLADAQTRLVDPLYPDTRARTAHIIHNRRPRAQNLQEKKRVNLRWPRPHHPAANPSSQSQQRTSMTPPRAQRWRMNLAACGIPPPLCGAPPPSGRGLLRARG